GAMRSNASSSPGRSAWTASCPKSRARRPRQPLRRPSTERNRVDLRRADEVVLREPLDRMRGELHAAVVVPHLEVRMMVLDVGDVRERVDEAHRPIEILELELPPQVRPFLRQHPLACELLHELLSLLARVGRHPTCTGLAMLPGQLTH